MKQQRIRFPNKRRNDRSKRYASDNRAAAHLGRRSAEPYGRIFWHEPLGQLSGPGRARFRLGTAQDV